MNTPSISDLRRMIKSLEEELKDERKKREKIEEDYREFQKRSIAREEEFFKVVERYNPNRNTSIQDNSEI